MRTRAEIAVFRRDEKLKKKSGPLEAKSAAPSGEEEPKSTVKRDCATGNSLRNAKNG
jgi:hypothetical protein